MVVIELTIIGSRPRSEFDDCLILFQVILCYVDLVHLWNTASIIDMYKCHTPEILILLQTANGSDIIYFTKWIK